MTTAKLPWGVLGTGNIARSFSRGVARSKTGRVVAVGSRAPASADKFGADFDIPRERRHGSYNALLADPRVQAIYISTPHPMHAEWAIKTAEAGKHVLCEKPIGMNHAEAMAIVEAADVNGVFLMEAFMYRCHPQTHRLVELLRQRVIGDVRMIHASFAFAAGFNPESRIFNNDLGGGGILDVGCYPVSMSRLVAGAAQGKDFLDPVSVQGAAHLGQTGVDEYAAAVLTFPAAAGQPPVIATVSCGVALTQDNTVRIFGTEGHILVPWPWAPAKEGGTSRIVVTRFDEQQPRDVTVETSEWLYGIEADVVTASLPNRQAAPPAMTWADTLGNMKTLDRWRESIGLVYEMEKAARQTRTVTGRPLRRRDDAPMKHGRIEGVEKPVSRLVMGVDNQTFLPHAMVMFDDFFEKGGNTFDTAWIYGPKHEGNLGTWIRNRGIREDVVVLDKGAHTPFCKPADLVRQHRESLERLQTDYVDIYMLHRDNPDVPAGEFIDVLNQLKRQGSIRAFGGSNWSIARVEEANGYAKSMGLTGFSAVSNNFSLARMVDPVWTGCISASDPESRAWFERTRMPLMAWSSQARGFFTERGAAADDPEMNRCWRSDDNLERRRRAIELAEKRGVLPINIALAYVLNQPFPTFPLIGPRYLWETRTSLPALTIELSPQELRWLNLAE